MMTENQRVILGDALDTLVHIRMASTIENRKIRESEIIELVKRIDDDIRTVLKLEKERRVGVE